MQLTQAWGSLSRELTATDYHLGAKGLRYGKFKVAQFMLEQRGVGRGSIITGSFVHNCRVERAHRDVCSGVLCFFARTFAHLEERGLLDPLNELHLFALHYTYIPRINKCLEEFKNQWESHPYPRKETVFHYSYILLVCLRMSNLVMLEWRVYLIPITHMNMDFIRQDHSLQRRKTTLW